MKRKPPIKGKHYVIRIPPTIVSPATRELAVCRGDYFVTYTGASRDIQDVEGYWPLPPDGTSLGEVEGSLPRQPVNDTAMTDLMFKIGTRKKSRKH